MGALPKVDHSKHLFTMIEQISQPFPTQTVNSPQATINPKTLSEADWSKRLSEEQFRVARMGGTERAFTGAYWNLKDNGTYHCVCCGSELFSSEAKFDSGTGWPSFWEGLNLGAITTHRDSSLGLVRTEIRCANCDAHLGHVFGDGPAPTGQRYCVNSVSLRFEEAS